jgi:hypothetical protein
MKKRKGKGKRRKQKNRRVIIIFQLIDFSYILAATRRELRNIKE